MENNNQSSFWQFSDNLRVETGNLANLSLNDSIWSNNYLSKRPAEERRNFDFRNGGTEVGSAALGGSVNEVKPDWNLGFTNDVWKAPMKEVPGPNFNYSGFGSPATGLNGGFNKGIYSSPSLNFNSYNKGKGFANNVVVNGKINKGYKNEDDHVGKKKNKGNKEGNKDHNGNNNGDRASVDKRFKTLPPAEALPRNETIGGYIFVCNNDTMAENLKRQLFGMLRFWVILDILLVNSVFLLTLFY